MSRRQRMKRRRARGGQGFKIVAFSFGIVAVVLAIGALSGVAYILTIAADAPDINSLKPVDKGAVSQVYAADGTRLGLHRRRRPAHAGLRQPDPAGRQARRRSRSRTGASTSTAGVDFEGIVRAAVKNVELGQDAPGRLDADDAARPQPLHAHASATFASARSARRSSPRSSRASGHAASGGSSTSTSTPCPTAPSAARRAVGIQAAARIFFDKPAHAADAARGGAAGRAAAGALATTTRSSTQGRPRARRNDVLQRDGRAGMHHRRPRRAKAMQRAARRQAEPLLHDQARELLLRLRQAGADRPATAPRPCARAG